MPPDGITHHLIKEEKERERELRSDQASRSTHELIGNTEEQRNMFTYNSVKPKTWETTGQTVQFL